jgi:hypothetical protein
MTRHPVRRALAAAAALACAAWGAAACGSSSATEAPASDTPACTMLRPVAQELGLSEPAVSSIAEDGCTAQEHEYGTLTLRPEDRPLDAAVSGDGKRTRMEIEGRDAVMLEGALNGVCKVFLANGDHSSVELRLSRTTAMTPQICRDVKKAAGVLAGRLPAPRQTG